VIVAMTMHMSGGRHDDRPWPPAWTEFEVPDWEGAELVRARLAVFVRDSVPPPPAAPAAPVVSEPSATAHGPVAQAKLGAEVEVPVEVAADIWEPLPPVSEVTGQETVRESGQDVPEPPAPSAPKQAWISYAVSQGAPADRAAAMSKADLMSRYGGRL
jgi:hypothetical protein